MKTTALKSLLASCLSFSTVALAAEKEAETDALVIKPLASVETYLNVLDSERNNALDFNTTKIRIGLNIKQSRASGKVIFSLNPANTVGVREANVGLQLPAGFEVQLGRLSLSQAVSPMDGLAYGTDSMDGPLDLMRMDAMRVGYKTDLGSGTQVGASLYHGNNLLTTDIAEWSQPSKTDSRATLIRINAKINESFEASATVGTQAKRVIESTPAAGTTPAVNLGADTSVMGLFASYTLSGLSAGAWYTVQKDASPRTLIADEGNKVKYDGESQHDRQYTSLGVGLNCDSTLINVSSLLAKDDKLTCGAGVQLTGKKLGVANESDNDKTLIAAEIGYNYQSFDILLGLSRESSKAKQYANKTGTANQNDARLGAYLKGSYIISN